MKTFKVFLEEYDYRGEHTSPDQESGAPAHNLTKIYPEDFYSSNGHILYGAHRSDDAQIHTLLRSLRNRPNKRVKVYRAIPKIKTKEEKLNDIKKQKAHILKYGKVPPGIITNQNSNAYYETLNNEYDKIVNEPDVIIPHNIISTGDWVSPNRKYAIEHGQDHLNNNYRLISKTVLAKDIYTNGDSFHEFGYHPKI